MIAIDLSKQRVLDAYPRATQKINLLKNLGRGRDTAMYFIAEEAKETIYPLTINSRIYFALI